MRVFLTPLLFFFIVAGLACAGSPYPSFAAAGEKKSANRELAKKGSAKADASRASALDKLIEEFENVKKDEKLSKRRDCWLALEEKFSRFRDKSSGQTAAQAAYYVACTREELGLRSFLASDHREAAAGFEAVAKKYTKSPVAASSLLRQSRILKNSLGEPAKAVPVLENLLKRYPKSKEAPQARKLLEEAENEIAQTAAAPRKTGIGSSVVIKNIFWEGKPQRALVTLELDGAAQYEYEFVPPDKTKKTPARIYLDIAGAFPSQDIKPGMTPKSLTVTRIRTAQSGDGTRIMFDCDGLRCFAVRTPKNAPKAIQIEVSRKEDIKDGIPVTRKDDLRAETGKAKGAEKKNAAEGDSLMEQLGLTVQTIMIDAGHGGKDPGAMAGSFVEKQFTLNMAKRVGALLQKKGFTVLYTRTSNKYVSLQDRPDIANHKKADLFISVHINANNNPEIRGLETYYLDVAKTKDAATVAARENAVSVKNISDLQVILTDLMLSSKLEESHELARMVHKGILAKARGAKFRTPDNGVRSAPFYVLMGARMPAILGEFGYITNKEDAKLLSSEVYLQSQAEGLVEGIIAYKAQLAKVAAR